MAVAAKTSHRIKLIILLIFAGMVTVAFWRDNALAFQQTTPAAQPATTEPPKAAEPTVQQVQVEGCVKCHNNIEPMHRYNATGDVFDKLVDGKDAQGLTCTACHGGNPAAATAKDAHVQPKYPKEWGCKNGECSSQNPERSNTLLAKESKEFVRFVNPGDFRVISQACGECHSDENKNVARGMMAHGAMLWGAALYNNGGFHIKDARFGESYNADGNPQSLIQQPAPTAEQQAKKGHLPFLDPLPRWELSQPGNILRVFERGGKRRLEVGNPDKEEKAANPTKA